MLVTLYILSLNLIEVLNTYNPDINNDNGILGKSLEQESEALTDVIKNIAYYLREYKFNEWDRRYYQEKPDEYRIGFFGTFPKPSLRTLHWEVKSNCHYGFYRCINYLSTVVESAPCLRLDDIAVLKIKNFDLLSDTTRKRLKNECQDIQNLEEKMGLPFDEPIEKFQWRTTAAYYMCWYTMLGIPALSMIGERCDNFANCLDGGFSCSNHDPRADDKLSFQCAKYSFCPDLCCPIKHIKSMTTCRNDKRNPCFSENTELDSLQRLCRMDYNNNRNFKDIVDNRWNITCYCNDGFQWKSEFGMCVDINECLFGRNDCDVISQDCLNLPGTFHCVCKFEFELDEKGKNCVKKNVSDLY